MKPLFVRIEDIQYEWVRQRAYDERRSMSDIVRDLIAEKISEVICLDIGKSLKNKGGEND